MTIVLNGTSGITNVDGTAAAPALTGSDTDTGIFFPAANTLAFSTAGTEDARFDSSGNLGIGTSSPSYKLDVNRGSSGVVARFTGGGASSFIYADSSQVYYGAAAGVPNCLLINEGSNYLTLNTNGNERMRLDSSGNLGLGVTPNTWAGTGVKAFQFQNGALAASSSFGTMLSWNAYYDGSYKYTASTTAGMYQVGGTHAWFTAPSGTAGNAISFTQAMTLDASGNLSLGTTSTTVWNGAAGTKVVVGGSGNTITSLQSSTTTVDQGAIFEGYATGISSNSAALGSIAFLRSNTSTTALSSYTAFYTNNAGTVAERARIDSSGNLGIGVTSIGSRLQVSGSANMAYFYDGSAVDFQIQAVSGRAEIGSTTNNALSFKTNNTERARIDSSGNLLVGTTSSAANSGTGVKLLPSGYVYVVAPSTTSDTYNYYNSTAGAYRFYVTNAGVINATSTTITAISDQRLKENIQDIDVGLDAVMALKPRKFDWKAGKGKDKKGDRGWIAQEFEQVFPDMITTWKDEPPEGEEPYKAVNADLIPVLVKAIQEQQAIIESLKADVAALKGNT